MAIVKQLALFLFCTSCDDSHKKLTNDDGLSSLLENCKADEGETRDGIAKRNVARLEEFLRSKNLSFATPASADKWSPLELTYHEGPVPNASSNQKYYSELISHTFEVNDPMGGDGYTERKALAGKIHGGGNNGCAAKGEEFIVKSQNKELKYLNLIKKATPLKCSFSSHRNCTLAIIPPKQHLYELALNESYAGTLDVDIEWEELDPSYP